MREAHLHVQLLDVLVLLQPSALRGPAVARQHAPNAAEPISFTSKTRSCCAYISASLAESTSCAALIVGKENATASAPRSNIFAARANLAETVPARGMRSLRVALSLLPDQSKTLSGTPTPWSAGSCGATFTNVRVGTF